jgi:hypothetical protein
MAYSYTQEDGSVAICSLLSSVPSGAEFIEVTSFPEDRVFRGAWRLSEGELTTNLPLAKEIAHEKRRQARRELYAPLDIEATIPSMAVEAEAARQVIRDADDIKQVAIDNAIDETGLRELL